MPIYAHAGVEWVWIIDPVEQTLEVKKLTGDKYLDVALHGGEETARIEPFTEIELDLTVIWGSAPAE